MTRFILAFGLLFCFISEGFAQKPLSDYSYVVVPEKFDFVNEVDKYQLNSLTRFLFNKHGFHAFFTKELPDVRRCDGLYAEVEGRPAIIRTKVTVILKDCYGTEVYRSEVGTSKLKAYNKTYTAALREAFLSIEALGIQQKDIVLFTDDGETDGEKEKMPLETLEEIPVTTDISNPVSEETVTKITDKTDQVLYANNGATFVLKSTNSSYSLYEKAKAGNALKGIIKIVGAEAMKFEDVAGNIFPCYFDGDKNLIIETSFQKLVFTKMRQ